MQDKSLSIRVVKDKDKFYIHWVITLDLLTFNNAIALYLNVANDVSSKLLRGKDLVEELKEYNRDEVLAMYSPSKLNIYFGGELVIDVILTGFEKRPLPHPVSMERCIVSSFTRNVNPNQSTEINYIFENQEIGNLHVDCDNSNSNIISTIIFKNTEVNTFRVFGKTMKKIYLKDNSAIIYVSPFFFDREGNAGRACTGVIINSMNRKPLDVTDLVTKYSTKFIIHDVLGEVYNAYFHKISINIDIDSTSSLLAEHSSFNFVSPFFTKCQLQNTPIKLHDLGKKDSTRSTSLIFKLSIPEHYCECTQPLHVLLSTNKLGNRKKFSVYRLEDGAGSVSTFESITFSINESGVRYILADDKSSTELLNLWN